MPNFVCLRKCVQDEMQVSQNFMDKPRRSQQEEKKQPPYNHISKQHANRQLPFPKRGDNFISE